MQTQMKRANVLRSAGDYCLKRAQANMQVDARWDTAAANRWLRMRERLYGLSFRVEDLGRRVALRVLPRAQLREIHPKMSAETRARVMRSINAAVNDLNSDHGNPPVMFGTPRKSLTVIRLDLVLVRLNLASNHTGALDLIRCGSVSIGGVTVWRLLVPIKDGYIPEIEVYGVARTCRWVRPLPSEIA